MREIDEATAENYLRDSGWISPREAVHVQALAGGVSNIVLLVTRQAAVEPSGRGASSADAPRINGESEEASDTESEAASDPESEAAGDTAPSAASAPLPERFVLKQARGRLRVAEPWYCSVERIWRETEVLSACGELLPAASAGSDPRPAVPRLLREDRPNYLFAMTAVPSSHQVWKSRLLAGEVRLEVAESAGRLLGALHAGSWQDAELAERFRDRQYFEHLRVDPYYRHLERRDATLRPAIQRLIDSLESHPRGLVHGDFSPKNLLVTPDRLTLVDFEVGHYGDPAFDLGFFQSHLVLKTFHAGRRWPSMLNALQRFQVSYRKVLAERLETDEIEALESRGRLHLSACGLARLDGKSPVEYLTNERLRATIRRLCRATLESPPESWADWRRELVDCLPEPEAEAGGESSANWDR